MPGLHRRCAAIGRAVLAAASLAIPVVSWADTSPLRGGLPQRIADFCATPTVISVGKGAWSDPATWFPRQVPGADDVVAIAEGTVVTYDLISDDMLGCVAVHGDLLFRTDVNTRLQVRMLMVMPGGWLEVGREGLPIEEDVTAEIVLADLRQDTTIDPEQPGTGFIGFGRITMHGWPKTKPATKKSVAGNFSRNVVIRSENPAHVRGDVIFGGQADVDIRFVLFRELGRTTTDPLEQTNSRHLHPAMEGKTALENGSQFTLIGNAIDGGTQWGITIRGAQYGLVRDNQDTAAPEGPKIAKAVLTPADFEFLGALKVPPEVSGFGWGGLALRRVGGELHFFVTGHRYDDDPVFEIDAPGFHPDLDKAPRASVITNWGTPYRKLGAEEGAYWTEDLEWHDGLLYWVYGHEYAVTGADDPSIGVSRLDKESDGIYGPWRTTVGAHRARGYVTTIPAWYAEQYTDGYRLAVGSGLRSGNVSSSWGSMLAAIPAPKRDVEPKSELDAVTLVSHDVDFDRRQEREPTYVADEYPDSPDRPVEGDRGWWTQTDQINAAVWIDTPEKHGVIFFGYLGEGAIWYGVDNPSEELIDRCAAGVTGPHAENYVGRWWIYDPMAFVPVSGGAPTIAPHATFDPTEEIPGAEQIEPNCFSNVTGAAFDPETQRLYVLYPESESYGLENLPVIYAFRIRGDSASNRSALQVAPQPPRRTRPSAAAAQVPAPKDIRIIH